MPIVNWAKYGEHIPLKCEKCGALFSTKNIAPIGCRTIFPGYSLSFEEEVKARECCKLKHRFEDLKPDKITYDLEKIKMETLSDKEKI